MYGSETLDGTAVLSEEEKRRVRSQVQRLLDTSLFRNSRRYPALLRFLVEETLEGRGEYLKERLIGIRVFDRSPDYDTATDPTVRVTIAEVRKRIAQYYHDEQHDGELRIELLPGRYIPEFRLRREMVHEPVVEAPEPPALLPIVEEGRQTPRSTAPPTQREDEVRLGLRGRSLLRLGGSLLLLLLVGLGYAWLRPSPLQTLWAPVLSSHGAILICLPTDVGKKTSIAGGENTAPVFSPTAPKGDPGSSNNPTFLEHETLGENIVYSDMLAALRVGNVLAAHHRDYRVRLNRTTTLDDLRHGPSILIGGLDNQWTVHALTPLRFHFAGSDEDRYWIADAMNPGNRDWSLDLKQHYTSVTRDFAIVARLHNAQTGQPQMIIAGIGMSGTAAAGEFLADEERMEELRTRLGAGFAERDFELVLSTEVINGSAGSAKIEAVWLPDKVQK